MPNTAQTVAYIVEQASAAGTVRARAMFGGHALYCDDKVVGLITDDRLFLKPTPGAVARLGGGEMAPPYPKGKDHFVADALLDDPDELADLIRVIAQDLPMSKPRKPRKTR